MKGAQVTSPKEPMPIGRRLPPDVSRKKATAFATVAAADSVGNRVTFRFEGSVPTAQMNFVPPASMAPNKITVLRVRRRTRDRAEV